MKIAVYREMKLLRMACFRSVSSFYARLVEDQEGVLTRLRHIHKLNGVLYVCLSVCGEMNGAEAALSNLFMHLVVVQNRAVIK